MAKTVYLGMIGDIMHPGYINIINKATEYGDVIIGLFTDKAIANHRRLPYLTWEQRKNVVESIRNVSRVVPQDDWSYVSNLLKYKPDYIIHGDDWLVGPDKYIRDEVFKVMEKLGGEVIEIPYTQNISASGIKQEIDKEYIVVYGKDDTITLIPKIEDPFAKAESGAYYEEDVWKDMPVVGKEVL